MNGKKDTNVEIEKLIDTERREKTYDSCYEPTTSELDDGNPPTGDSGTDLE